MVQRTSKASTTDLARARRIRRNLRELAEVVNATPERRRRFAAHAAGRIPDGRKEVAVDDTQQTVTSIRINRGVIERLDALLDPLARDPELGKRGRLSRSDLIREALVRGVEALERRARKVEEGDR